MTRYLLAISLLLSACSTVPAPQVDGGIASDGGGCDDVAAAYEAARSRFACSYDWPNCPRTITNGECVAAFAQVEDCQQLDSVASRCSL